MNPKESLISTVEPTGSIVVPCKLNCGTQRFDFGTLKVVLQCNFGRFQFWNPQGSILEPFRFCFEIIGPILSGPKNIRTNYLKAKLKISIHFYMGLLVSIFRKSLGESIHFTGVQTIFGFYGGVGDWASSSLESLVAKLHEIATDKFTSCER